MQNTQKNNEQSKPTCKQITTYLVVPCLSRYLSALRFVHIERSFFGFVYSSCIYLIITLLYSVATLKLRVVP